MTFSHYARLNKVNNRGRINADIPLYIDIGHTAILESYHQE